MTPSFQQARFLEECLSSVRAQSGVDVEHLVVDGGSTDGSKAIIESRADSLAWWCSEADHGQSDALNKGLSHATGEIFGWLNSDDRLLPGALEEVAEAFAADPDLQVFEGVRMVVDGDVSPASSNDPSDIRSLFIEPRINQQSTFYRTSLVRRLGGLDPALHFVMDLELWYRFMFLTGGTGLRVVDRPLAEFRIHPESKTGVARERFRHEQAGVLHGLCLAVGETTLADILRIGYHWPAGIRPVPMAEGQGDRVRDMVVHFLLKWDRGVHHRVEFERMKALLAWLGIELFERDPLHGERIADVKSRIGLGSWDLYRVRRKLKHLFR
ncbi:MAG: glycosyltransferase [Flavobacteriales bacterium]|nr:glycosyltransferase [Flavobacteriales bacterium]